MVFAYLMCHNTKGNGVKHIRRVQEAVVMLQLSVLESLTKEGIHHSHRENLHTENGPTELGVESRRQC